MDLGDTGGFQAAVLWPETARGARIRSITRSRRHSSARSALANPARGLNLFSAIWARSAVGLLAVIAGRLTKAPLAGAAAGLLLAFSYTFWTQAIIAEVYSLHLALLAFCLLALHGIRRATDNRPPGDLLCGVCLSPSAITSA